MKKRYNAVKRKFFVAILAINWKLQCFVLKHSCRMGAWAARSAKALERDE